MYQRLIHTGPRENIRGNDRLFKPDHGLLQLQVASLTFYHYCFSHQQNAFLGGFISPPAVNHIFLKKQGHCQVLLLLGLWTLSMKSIMNLTFDHTCYNSVPYLAVTSLRENTIYIKVRAVSYYYSYLNYFNLINLGEPLVSIQSYLQP